MSMLRASLFILGCVVAPLAAAESGYFLGGSLGKSLAAKESVNIDYSSDNYTESDDIDVGGRSVFVGYYNSKNNRFLLSYEALDVELTSADVSLDVTGFSFDWQFVYGKETVKPFWGIGTGLYTMKDAHIVSASDQTDDSLDGISFQMRAGIKVTLTPAVELDASLQRQAIAWQIAEVYANGDYYDIQTTYVHNSLNVGAAYRF